MATLQHVQMCLSTTMDVTDASSLYLNKQH